MGLSNALNIGKTGLFAAQTALEVTGNNLANIATQGYHRRSVNLAPMGTQRLTGDMLIGRGVQVESIVRHVNEALEGRIRTSIADQAASEARRSILSQVEALENELSGNDLSTYLSEFFDAWSELANNPRDNSLRSLVVQQGARLGQFVQDLQQGFGELRIQTDKAIDGAAAEADDLLETIARLNRQIIVQEAGSRSASSLRDERGLVLAQLGEYLDISTIEQAAGGVDVFVGSLPVVLNNQSRGLEVRRETVNGELQINVVITDDGSRVVRMTAGLDPGMSLEDGRLSKEPRQAALEALSKRALSAGA